MPDAFVLCGTVPHILEYAGEKYYRVQGVDRAATGMANLFFASSGDKPRQMAAAGVELRGGEWIGTGTFRNSLYIDPMASLTNIRDLNVLVEYSGAVHFRLFCATLGKPLQVIKDLSLFSLEPTTYLIHIGSPTDLPESSRVFWHAEASDGGTVLYDVSYVTNSGPRTDCRLLVLLRTFGRTVDAKSILKRFADAAKQDPFYQRVLRNIQFFLLDTTRGCEAEYSEPWLESLNLEVWTSANLGGGGNAGHMLKLLEDRFSETGDAPTELLILDDDLSVSMESLARYFMLRAYRAQDFICSLPVLMKSRPTVVWEDGGFWGRLNFHEGGSLDEKRNLFPNLLKHGTDIQDFTNLDIFSPLNPCEYATFIFFGLSAEGFRKLGFPAAFFLRGDDIEYSLRAQRMGIPMFTNPNLAAWHEPAHSYAQEYMAIMHGVIINLTYGEHKAEFFVRFFEERLHEHASIDDIVGLSVYNDILYELVNPESAVLSEDFQPHYLDKLKALGSIKTVRLQESDRQKLEQRAKDTGALVVPFVYPGYHKRADQAKRIIVFNPSAKAYREVEPKQASAKLRVMKDYLERLIAFEENFAHVLECWQQRLKRASSEDYWGAIKLRYHEQTRKIFQSRMAGESDGVPRQPMASDITPCPTPVGTDAIKSVSSTPADSARARRPNGGSRPADDLPRRGWLMKLRENMVPPGELAAGQSGSGTADQRPSTVRDGDLPVDFDPDVYLHFNPDVKTSGVNAADHYLKYGRKEGRRYKFDR